MRDILIASVIIAATVVCCAVFIIKLIRKNSECAGDIVSILCIAGAGVCIITAAIVLLLTRLRASQEKENLEHVIDHLNAMAVLWDTNFSYVRVNNSLVRITYLSYKVFKIGLSGSSFKRWSNNKITFSICFFNSNIGSI